MVGFESLANDFYANYKKIPISLTIVSSPYQIDQVYIGITRMKNIP